MVNTISPAVVVVVSLLLSLYPAAARGGHGLAHHFGGHGHGMAGTGSASLSASGRHADDAYVRAASEDREKLLDTRIKSICRGC